MIISDQNNQKSPYDREYNRSDVSQLRKITPPPTLATHQSEALGDMLKWYNEPNKNLGGILVLPTGGGKTQLAMNFLCNYPLSNGYRILWLAHTHHLLNQALESFDKTISPENMSNESFRVQVVSGASEHLKPNNINENDDMLICTLQTATKAFENRQSKFMKFLKAANTGLFIVFDEAHHAPAPTYSKLLKDIQGIYKKIPVRLLGLTATPEYSNESKQGLLRKLFPQGIIAQTSAEELMLAKILAKPITTEVHTQEKTEFNEQEYKKWSSAYGDLPQQIITNLTKNQPRNDLIVDHYIKNKEKYGKTIIFADRVEQCEYFRDRLCDKKIRVDAVYSHVEPRGFNKHNPRGPSENAKIIDDFKKNKLDVIINIRMLTEGTDVPDVQTAFLTRQTTSKILLKQMVGRALRGPKFGGTDKAHIVSFIDNWEYAIDWATYDQIKEDEGFKDDEQPKRNLRPLKLISIDLIRRLIKQMYGGHNINSAPYTTFLPIGWYEIKYNTVVSGDDDLDKAHGDTNDVHRLIMVYDSDEDNFKKYITALCNQYDKLQDFEHLELLNMSEIDKNLKNWQEEFFGGHLLGRNAITTDLLDLARHVVQNLGDAPKFIPFDHRDDHNLDEIALEDIKQDKGLKSIDEQLQREFEREDRAWKFIYGDRYKWFKSEYYACVSRIQHPEQHDVSNQNENQLAYTSQYVPENEPSDEIKKKVKERDQNRCLCCGNENRRELEIDHIIPKYEDLNHDLDNLQTLCSTCNRQKGIKKIDFRKHQTELTKNPDKSSKISIPNWKDDPSWKEYTEQWGTEQWGMYLRRSVNFFYCCAAVESIDITIDPQKYIQMWSMRLHLGNDPKWFQPKHMSTLRENILNGSCKMLRGLKSKNNAKPFDIIDEPSRFAITVQPSKMKKIKKK